MKHLKWFNEDKKEKLVKEIIGELTNNFYKGSNFVITDKGIGVIINSDYTFDEIKEFYIQELPEYKENKGRYISRVFLIFEHGNISGRMYIEIIFKNENPILAILSENESKIDGDILTTYDQYGILDTINLDLLSKNSDIK